MHGTVLNAMTIQRLLFPSILKSYCLSRWCLQAREWLNTIAWNFSDLPDSTKLISSASQTHSPLIYTVCSLCFLCLCPSTWWSTPRKMKTNQETHRLWPPVNLCELFSSSTSPSLYSSTTVWLPSSTPPWTTVTDSIVVLLIDNSNAPFLILKL